MRNGSQTTFKDDPLVIAGRGFRSRLLVGTGKFSSPAVLQQVIKASGCEVITVALRRVNLREPQESVLRDLDVEGLLTLPNTSGARTADEAIHMAELGRKLVGHGWVKLEVTPNWDHLLPDPLETRRAAEELVDRGFTVLPYINADPVLAQHLEDVGCAAVMPLGAPIGSNRGLRNADMLQAIIEDAGVPVIVDAGLGVPSHACRALELGADAVLVNTALATASDPARMAWGFAQAVAAGRAGFLARPGRTLAAGVAAASSPLAGVPAGGDHDL